MKRLSLTFDRDYGIYNRTGWTICVNGCVIVELERSLIIAIIKGLFKFNRRDTLWQ